MPENDNDRAGFGDAARSGCQRCAQGASRLIAGQGRSFPAAINPRGVSRPRSASGDGGGQPRRVWPSREAPADGQGHGVSSLTG